MSIADPTTLPVELSQWLDSNAQGLDLGSELAPTLLPMIAEAGLFKIGVAARFGGSDGDVADATRAIAAVSARSLAAGFVFWGHRTFIECLMQSPNDALRERLLPGLLAGRRPGATGLSNAMKFLCGLGELQIKATRRDRAIEIDGKLPWVTNLRPDGFDVAAAVQGQGCPAFVVNLSSDQKGFNRSDDLDLMAMRATNTAAIKLERVRVDEDRIIHPNATESLPRVRPAFLGLQCGMSIGLARRSLAEARGSLGGDRDVLASPMESLIAELTDIETRLLSQMAGSLFVEQPVALFRLRIRLAEIVNQAVQLELSTTGGKAYLSGPGEGFQRRLRESAFIPIVTPSLALLKTVIDANERQSIAPEIA